MLRSYRSAVALFSTCVLLSSPAYAGLFFVDTGPIVVGFGRHTLQVTGTIDVDLTTDAVLGSDLRFFHESDPGVQLPNIPTGSGVDFVLAMDVLFIGPGANINTGLTWETFETGFGQSFIISQGPSSGGPAFQVVHTDSEHIESTKIIGGAQGLKLGTVAVPEPSAFVLLSLVGFVGVGSRWWRTRRTRI